MADWLNLIGIVIGGGSLVVAIVALCKSGAAQRVANDAQRRLVDIEEHRETDRLAREQRAEPRLELRETSPHGYRLYIINRGQAAARNIDIRIDERPLAEHPSLVEGETVPTVIGPDAEASCALALHMQCTPPFETEIIWDDDSGHQRSYRTTLTF